MNRKKTKLRLRKQVLISFPLALIVSVFAVIYIFSQNTALAQEVEKDNALMTNTEVIVDKENYEPSILSTNKFIVELNRRMKLQKKDNLIEEYAKLYQIDGKKAVSIAHELTDEYIVYKEFESKIDKRLLERELNSLNDRERHIMKLRYGLNNTEEYTQKEVAKMLGISQSYISRIEKKVIKQIKNIMTV